MSPSKYRSVNSTLVMAHPLLLNRQLPNFTPGFNQFSRLPRNLPVEVFSLCRNGPEQIWIKIPEQYCNSIQFQPDPDPTPSRQFRTRRRPRLTADTVLLLCPTRPIPRPRKRKQSETQVTANQNLGGTRSQGTPLKVRSKSFRYGGFLQPQLVARHVFKPGESRPCRDQSPNARHTPALSTCLNPQMQSTQTAP